MAERSLSALVITDPANLFYLSGYDAWSFYVPQCLIVPAEGDPQLFARAMDAAGARFTSVLPDEQVHAYPEELVHRPDVHPFDWIAGTAQECGALTDSPDSAVAVEGDSHFFSARSYLALTAALPRSRFVDSVELVNWVRLVKSEHELHQLRIAGSIAQQAMQVALEAVAVGRRQCDVAGEIMAALASGTEQHGGDYAAIIPLLPTGEGAGTPHLTWTDLPFVEGEATTIELAGVFGRYHAPFARTVMLGEPSERLTSTAKVAQDGMAAALEAAVPGAAASDVHAAFNAVIAKHGLTKDSRIGYSIGIGYPPDWGERTVSLRAQERTVLVPGMSFHVILGMWMDGWGYEVSEPVVIADSGVERLTDLPQELTIRR
ncbi:MAG: M24 family metallopeptidase [Actinomycetota bacterium]|nr:M24 family metallopeptidase [Actinomycetota bacterium]